jgi:isoleucyl-tRNA synthetase
MVCVVPQQLAGAVTPLFDLLEAELNVKTISLASSADSLVTFEAKPNFRSLGKKFGKRHAACAQAVAAFTSDELRAFEHGRGARDLGRQRVANARCRRSRHRTARDGALTVKEEDGRFAAIDPEVTPELRREGIARELVSQLQRLRRDLGFAVSDRIRLWIVAPDDVASGDYEYNDWIAN